MPSRSSLSARHSILITGAAGNLGSMLARYLAGRRHELRLMYHRKEIAPDLRAMSNVDVVQADLSQPATLDAAVGDSEVVVHFAGILFAPRPERFLPETNTRWFANLVAACRRRQVQRLILISFPHVEGPTTPEHPATGRLDRTPISMHAKTRLEEERLLLSEGNGESGLTPVILRLGMVYGAGVLMIEAARYLARRRLLGVWRQPTVIQLISVIDYLRTTESAILREGVRGIYHVGDEQPVTLQYFLDSACDFWGYHRPIRMPVWMINAAALCTEAYATLARTQSPLTRDFIRIGRVPYWGETTRMRGELLPALEHPTFESGLATLAPGSNRYFH